MKFLKNVDMAGLRLGDSDKVMKFILKTFYSHLPLSDELCTKFCFSFQYSQPNSNPTNPQLIHLVKSPWICNAFHASLCNW